MPGTNRISISFTDEDLKSIQDSVSVLELKLKPLLVKISANERRELPKMGDKTVSFVTKAAEYAENNPSLVPQFIDIGEMRKDISIISVLRTLTGPLNALSDMLNDTMLLAGSEAYSSALAFYGSVKYAARFNQPAAESIYNDLKQQFPRPAVIKEETNVSA
jgi:hypothetical protein